MSTEPRLPDGYFRADGRYVLRFEADGPEYARIMANALLDTLTRRMTELKTDRVPIHTPREYPARNEQDRRLQELRKHGYERLCRSMGFPADRVLIDEPPTLREILSRGADTTPGRDHFGVPIPRPDRLFWEWANYTPPLSRHCPCASPEDEPGPSALPTPVSTPVSGGIFDAMHAAIAWSRERRQQPEPPPSRWSEVVDTWQTSWRLGYREPATLPLGRRARMGNAVGERARRLSDDQYKRLIHGEWITEEPEHQEESEWLRVDRHQYTTQFRTPPMPPL